MAGSLFNLFDAMVVVFAALYLEHVSISWVSLHSVYVSLTVISLILTMILPESPKFLVSRKDYEGAAKAYNFIARVNNNSSKELNRDIHRFKEEKSADKRAVKRQFKKTQ